MLIIHSYICWRQSRSSLQSEVWASGEGDLRPRWRIFGVSYFGVKCAVGMLLTLTVFRECFTVAAPDYFAYSNMCASYIWVSHEHVASTPHTHNPIPFWRIPPQTHPGRRRPVPPPPSPAYHPGTHHHVRWVAPRAREFSHHKHSHLRRSRLALALLHIIAHTSLPFSSTNHIKQTHLLYYLRTTHSAPHNRHHLHKVQ